MIMETQSISDNSSLLEFTKASDTAKIPVTPANNNDQKRFINSLRCGPENACKRLVTKEGISINGIASFNPKKAVKTASETVGSPSPITPFVSPARKNVTPTIKKKFGSAIKINTFHGGVI